MIKVTVGDTLNRTQVVVPETDTIRSVLDANNINYSKSGATLDGAALRAGDMDKTFADFGITGECYLIAVTKTENA